MPNSIKTIGDGAFKGCSGINKLLVTDGVVTIGKEAFSDTGIMSVEIPNSVKAIGEKAFANCINLNFIKSHIFTPFKLDASVFEYYNSDYDLNSIYYGATLYVPQGRKNFYSMVESWNKFLNIEENKSTNVKGVASDCSVRILAKQGEILVSGLPAEEAIHVYNLDGRIEATAKSNGNTTSIRLASDCTYVVKAGDKTVKVRL